MKIYLSTDGYRELFIKSIINVFSTTDMFLDYLEDYDGFMFDIFIDGSGECYIIERSSGLYVNWYKESHIGRDIHTNIKDVDLEAFLVRLKHKEQDK